MVRTTRGAKGNAGEDPTTAKMSCNKSCDSCHTKKRKCDGAVPCGRCAGAGDTCSYSRRRPRRDFSAQPPGAFSMGPVRKRGIHVPASPPGRRGVAATKAAFQQKGPKPVSLKRCTLSPSPATGLVGMQENAFLSDYFGCIGFLPFTSQRSIRETLVKIFVASSSCSEQHSASGDYLPPEQNFDTIAPASRQLPADPSTCVFWCAVALGSLVQGRPIESVAEYSRLAKDTLANVSGPRNSDVARAWAILAYLSDFCGEHENFNKYLKRANVLLCDVGEAEIEFLPVGLAEAIKQGETVKHFVGDIDREEVEMFCSQQRAQPQMTAAAAEGDISQLVMRSFRSFEQAIHENLVEDRESADHGRVGGGETCTDITPGGVPDADTRDEGSAPYPSRLLDMVRNVMRKHASKLQRLEHVAAGTLVFGKAAGKDIRGALYKLDYCGEVLERYPGLCRFIMGWVKNTATRSLGRFVLIETALMEPTLV